MVLSQWNQNYKLKSAFILLTDNSFQSYSKLCSLHPLLYYLQSLGWVAWHNPKTEANNNQNGAQPHKYLLFSPCKTFLLLSSKQFIVAIWHFSQGVVAKPGSDLVACTDEECRHGCIWLNGLKGTF